MRFFLCALGLAIIMEGIPYFAFPEKMKDLLARVQGLSEGKLRVVGLAAMLAGLLLVYIGRG